MRRIKELGAVIKKKYPGKYDDVADERLGIVMKQEYPADYSDFFDDETFNKVSQLVEYYKPSRGRLSSWWQRGKAESRVKLLRVLNEEQSLVLQQAAMLEEAVREGRLKMVEFEMFLAQHHFTLFQMKAQASLIEQALAEGYTVENYQQVKLDNHRQELKERNRQDKNEWKMIRENNRTKNQILLEDNRTRNEMLLQDNDYKNRKSLETHLSNLKIREAQEIGAIELNHSLQEQQEKLRLAILAKNLSGYQQRVMVQELLDQCYQQIEDIQFNTKLLPETKMRMIEDREEIIRFFKAKSFEMLLINE